MSKTNHESNDPISGRELSDLLDAICADPETVNRLAGDKSAETIQAFVDAAGKATKSIIAAIVMASLTRYSLDPSVTAAMGLVLGIQFGREIEARRRDSADLAKSVSNGPIS